MGVNRKAYQRHQTHVIHEVIKELQPSPPQQPELERVDVPKTLTRVGTVYKNNLFSWNVSQTDLINSKDNFITFHGTSTLVVNGLSDMDISRIDIKSNLYGISYDLDLADSSITNESPFEAYRTDFQKYEILQENMLHSWNNQVYLVIPGGSDLNFIQSSWKTNTNISKDKMDFWYKVFQVPKIFVRFNPIMFKWDPVTKLLYINQQLDLSVPSYTNTEQILNKNYLNMFQYSCFVNII